MLEFCSLRPAPERMTCLASVSAESSTTLATIHPSARFSVWQGNEHVDHTALRFAFEIHPLPNLTYEMEPEIRLNGRRSSRVRY